MEYNNLSQTRYSNAIPGYLENSALKLKPFYHTDLKNSLEDIVFKVQPEKEKSLLGKVFSDKSKTLKATVKALLNEIELRESLDSHLLSKANGEICKLHTNLMQLKNLKTQYSFDLSKEVNKMKMQLENNVLELEKEKRKEYLECWRDLMFLKKYLLSSLKDYWDLIKKREVLSHDFTELTKNETSKGH